MQANFFEKSYFLSYKLMHMKISPNDPNEIHDLSAHTDASPVTVTFLVQLPDTIAEGFTHAFKAKVQSMHANPANLTANARGNVRAQTFEEGEVALAVEPAKDFAPDLYIMDFYDTRTREICSRMHMHTGMRMVTIITAPETTIQISSLTPMVVRDTEQQPMLDRLPGDTKERHTFEVQPNCVVVVQIPTGVSHQFNAVGPGGLIISTHIEEMAEVEREKMHRPNMMAQTIFLQDLQPTLEECGIKQDAAKKINSMLQQFLLKENARGYISALQAAKIFDTLGMSTNAHALDGIINAMAKEGHPDTKKVETPVKNASTTLIAEKALGELRARYEQKYTSK